MISFETKTKIEELEKKYKDVLSVVNEDEINKELEEVEKKLTDPSVWDDQKKAREYTQKLKRLKNISEDLKRVRSLFEDLEVAIELSDEDQEMAQHVEEIVQELEGAVKKLELEIILNGKYDPNNAYLSVHPGAGGTESQDWAQMLLRMYMRWAERKGFDVEIVEFQPGEEAGIKDATILIKGEYAYGYLKHESGVHRLVRISPFDAARRRHTSFASVNVIPEIDDDVDIEIRPEDLKIETFRASGHGGQYVNKTESAVRITHLPTGIVVSCQNERSQHQNKQTALKILKAKLYQLEMEKKRREIQEIQGELKDISWGNQIRSYIFHPYTMVKDHRTGVETANVDAVMDGDIDMFIEAELVYFARRSS
ncbi:peptide chain release factor 2 [Thermotoga maritima MSB8]|nr:MULTISPECIES: peptide chain release factor 2 [Thermotoga]B1LB88.1 RecName: Full=Peptide chain release factor 2; Short=RF-2 [Thermotoga sp. RQ2]ACB09586.1 peptide chain release factor 2 [Thermotoga sp. RQ2]ADA67314.1 peptide chain release factor 2 [Thermotoga petrophila RKU-10]AGL50511.1 Peptide chain release factor 2 [Thermotoga maritima MSB8]AHD18524.1 peptide chain release factor 2 [Thermotoga maritima MSB8]AKE27466.1 peptide chain release factor 2 [Thermotoga maritima]